MHSRISETQSWSCSIENVRLGDPLGDKNWDAKLQAHPQSNVFHSAGWARVLKETYDYKPLYFLRENDAHVLDLVPVMEVRSRLTGARGVSLPFTDACPPLVADPVKAGGLYKAILDYGRRCGWKYFETRGGADLLPGTTPSLQFYGHHFDLQAREAELFRGFKSECRTAIRRAQAAGVRIEISESLESVASFYRLHCDTRKRHGLPPQPFSFFERIQGQILSKGNGFVALAWFAKVPISAAVFFHSGTKALYKFGASDCALQKLRASNLIIWEAMLWLARRGVRTLDFGRTSVANEGLRRFKMSWGCTERMVPYFRFHYGSGSFVAMSEGTEGWHTRVFRILPKPVSRLAGRLLYRHIG